MAGPAETSPYTARAMGRPLTKPRPKQGARLAALRKAAGLSQAELARAIGVPQSNLAYWETSTKPPSSDVLPKLADVLGVHVEVLLGREPVAAPRSPGPVGKLRQVFDEASCLPRSKQRLVAEFVQTLVEQHRRAG